MIAIIHIDAWIHSRQGKLQQIWYSKFQVYLPKNMENSSKNLVPSTMTSLFPAPDHITGLTGPQKCAINAAWQLMKKDFQIHARNVFAM